jgi:hypothetical protein
VLYHVDGAYNHALYAFNVSMLGSLWKPARVVFCDVGMSGILQGASKLCAFALHPADARRMYDGILPAAINLTFLFSPCLQARDGGPHQVCTPGAHCSSISSSRIS